MRHATTLRRLFFTAGLVLLGLTACNKQDAGKAAPGTPGAEGSQPAAAAGAQASDTLAKVNGKAIPKVRLEALVKERVAQGQKDSPELRNFIREELIGREVLIQEAAKHNLESKPEVAEQLDSARQAVLVRAFIDQHLKSNEPTEESMRLEFESIKSQLGDKEFHARHILVKTEAEASAILARLKAGEAFVKLAREKSMDPGSKASGGDLGWKSPANFVKPFADAMRAMKKGETSTSPVQSNFGWHIIKVDEVRELKAPTFDMAKAQVRQRMIEKGLQKLLADLRAQAKVE